VNDANDHVIVSSVHEVRDFERWKGAFDRGMSANPTPGLLGYRLYRAVDDGDEILLSLTFASIADAEQFIEGADEAWLANAGLDVYPPMFVGTPLEIIE
jgi:hypothetical protein